MNDKTILELVDKFSEGSLTEMTLEQGDWKLVMKKGGEASPVPAPAAAAPAATEAAGVAASGSKPAEPAAEAAGTASGGAAPSGTAAEACETVTSPIVGTFFRSPSPDAPAFVEEGSSVQAGETLCILEAMKMMNHLEAEFPCRVEKVLVENGAMVEFGTPLFEVTRL